MMGQISSCLSTMRILERVSLKESTGLSLLSLLDYSNDFGEEYDDDTAIIPRSTSIIARRLPAARPGKGGAARYVSGKVPVNARNTQRAEQSSSNRAVSNSGHVVNSSMSELNNAQTEDEKIKALFNLQANQWKEQQQEMAK